MGVPMPGGSAQPQLCREPVGELGRGGAGLQSTGGPAVGLGDIIRRYLRPSVLVGRGYWDPVRAGAVSCQEVSMAAVG